MANKPRSTVNLLTRLPEVVSSEPPRHAEGHDEWLLDEALAETFPASDSIAVSPHHLLHTSLSRKPREADKSSEIPDCKIGSDDLKPTALDIPIECDHCHTTIPATVAISFEGADYIYHFCGPQCIEAWCMKANLR